MFKISQLFEEIVNKEMEWKEMLSKMVIENGNVKLFHYSSNKITDEYLSVRSKQNLWSKGEYQAWGRSRLFFYCREDGVNYDKGVPTDYKYICYIPLKEIYPININPNEYKSEKDKSTWESLYEQASNDGYTAFAYYYSNNKNVPIVISFKDVKISEGLELRGGGYFKIGEEVPNIIIGEYNDSRKHYYVVQKGDLPKTLNNCYLVEDKTDLNNKIRLEVYQYKYITLYEQYINSYSNDFLGLAKEDYRKTVLGGYNFNDVYSRNLTDDGKAEFYNYQKEINQVKTKIENAVRNDIEFSNSWFSDEDLRFDAKRFFEKLKNG